MRKEVLWAIIAGIILGLIVAFGVYRVNSSIKNKNRETIQQTPTPKPSTPGEFKVVLDKPENNDVITDDFVAVSGLTKALSLIVITTEESDYITQSKEDGSFNQEINLIPGINQIKVTAFYPKENNGNVEPSATKVLVVYSSSFKTKTEEIKTVAENASQTASVKEKVEQELADTLDKPKAYIGTVTDITDSTIEIKTTASEIKQISVGTNITSVVNSTGTTTKNVKVADIAIGDFIVAMGYINSNSVLISQRILITNAVTEPNITITQAKVSEITKKTISLNKIPSNTEDIIQPETKTEFQLFKDQKLKDISLSDIEKDNIVIYSVVSNSRGETFVRSIFKIDKNQN